PGRGRGQVAPLEAVVDGQGHAVELAGLAIRGVGRGRHLQRIEERGLVDRRGGQRGQRRYQHDTGGRLALLVEALVVPADPGAGVVAEAGLERGAGRPVVFRVQVLAADRVLQPAIAVIEDAVEAERGIVAYRDVGHTLEVGLVVVAQAQLACSRG